MNETWDTIIHAAGFAGRTKMVRRDSLQPGDYAISSHYGPRVVKDVSQHGNTGGATHIVWVGGTKERPFSERYDSHSEIPLIIATGVEEDSEPTEPLFQRLKRIISEIELGMQCSVRVEYTEGRGWFVQIRCYREDTITKQMGYGFGGKSYPSEYATDSEIIQMIFGLYKSYWEHEARETFIWRGRRPFGPHISTEALWEVARRVDVRSQKHTEDQK